jgi:LysM repeat protein
VTAAAPPRTVRRRSLTASTRRLASRVVTSAWLLFLLAAAGAIATLLFLHRGDAEGSARRANEEIDRMLVRGERVEQRAAVMQRNWWDHFRVTHGILAATDRRLLFVGIPPASLIRRDYEPPDQVEVILPYEPTLSARTERQFLGTLPGVRLTGSGGRATIAVASAEPARVDSVLAVVRRRQEALRLAAQAERRAAEATAAASRRAIYHLVQPGEALDLIARRYGVSVDSVIAWNRLPSSRITAGRRLLVKPETP